MIQIDYKIDGFGWAVGKIENEEKQVEFAVSYLHDSLKELAKSAIEIRKNDIRLVVFMGEPGEHVLILHRKDENLIDYELRWYKDWWSWGLIGESNFKLVLKGQTTLPKYVNQVRNILHGIITELGPEEYQKKWIEHDFPMAEYEKLK
jgi:hypothetical protein